MSTLIVTFHWRLVEVSALQIPLSVPVEVNREGTRRGVRCDSGRPRGYPPRGQPPLVRTHARRSRLSLLAVITNRSAVRFVVYRGAFTTRHVITFLKRLSFAAGRKVFLNFDHLNVPKAKAVRAWLARITDEIRVFHSPSYSPERHPSDPSNGEVKESVTRQAPARDVADFHATVPRHARRIYRQQPRVTNYFGYPLIA